VLGGSGVQDVVATAKCGLQGGLAPVPLLVLNPTAASAFSLGGTAHVTIAGGPSRSIQVNSNNATAAGVSNNPQIDLTAGGPNFNGSSFGVTGGPGTAPIGFFTNPPAGWQSATAPIPDPFRKLAPPTVPATVPVKTGILPLVDGCPVGLGLTCIEYAPGTYPTGITVSSGTAPCPASGTCYALFAPGVYYLGGDLTLWSGSMVRPTDPNALLHNSPPFGKGDGSMGTTFYFQNGAKINVGANSGASAGCLPLSPTATINCFDTSKALCPSQLAFDSRLNIPAYVDGNVFLGPCTKYGTYPGASVNGNVDAVGTNRGMLFFQDHSKAAAPQFHGSGAFLLNGSMYFHSTDYQTSIGMWGGTGSGTQLVGLIVVDKLNISGNSTIFMDLSPMPFNGLSVALLQ